MEDLDENLVCDECGEPLTDDCCPYCDDIEDDDDVNFDDDELDDFDDEDEI